MPRITAPVYLGAVLLLCSLFMGVAGRAAPSVVPEINVRTVTPSLVREARGWLEIEVELEVKAVSGGQRFVDRVHVTLWLAYEAGSGGRSLISYRAEAECVALPAGRSRVRFYLPPEVVERDRVRPGDLYYAVDLTADTRAVELSTAAVSSTLRNAPSLSRFRERVAAESGRNDGILLPQYFSPFAQDTERPSPSFVRRERNGP